jgi:hypothetical protein
MPARTWGNEKSTELTVQAGRQLLAFMALMTQAIKTG